MRLVLALIQPTKLSAVREALREFVRLMERLAAARAAVDDEPIHNWFGLTYANYLTLNRSLLQSMRKTAGRQKTLSISDRGVNSSCAAERCVKQKQPLWLFLFREILDQKRDDEQGDQ